MMGVSAATSGRPALFLALLWAAASLLQVASAVAPRSARDGAVEMFSSSDTRPEKNHLIRRQIEVTTDGRTVNHDLSAFQLQSASEVWREAYNCDTTKNFILHLPYNQLSLTGYSAKGANDGHPTYDRTTRIRNVTKAVEYCKFVCSARMASCTGFFFQRHTNDHEICGFFTVPLGNAQKIWGGHLAGSQICVKSPPPAPVPTPAPATSGCDFNCDTTKNFITGLGYRQIDCDGSKCGNDPVTHCKSQCAGDGACTGFFYQMHMNGHEICGFFTLPLDEGTKSWHGHRDGSQLCEKVTPCVPTPPPTPNDAHCSDVWDVAAPSAEAPSATCGGRVKWLMENWAGGMDRQEAEKSVGNSYSQCSACKNEHYDLIWNDEFGSWDPNKWDVKQWNSGLVNKELQAYTNESSNSFIQDGALHIVAKRTQYANRRRVWEPPSLMEDSAQYTSARMESKLPNGSFKYGRFEIRAQLPVGDGTWPALWMLHTTEWYGRWPDSGEIDIMEHSLCGSPGVVKATVHTNAKNFLIGTNPVGSWTLDPSVFHVYGLDWTPDELKITVDGNQFFHYTRSGHWFDWPFDQPFRIILNVAVGGGFYAGCPGFDPDLRCSETYTSGGCRRVWNTNANGHTCGDRITFVKNRDGISWAEAEKSVGNEQPLCRPCAECQKMIVDWVRVYSQKP